MTNFPIVALRGYSALRMIDLTRLIRGRAPLVPRRVSRIGRSGGFACVSFCAQAETPLYHRGCPSNPIRRVRHRGVAHAVHIARARSQWSWLDPRVSPFQSGGSPGCCSSPYSYPPGNRARIGAGRALSRPTSSVFRRPAFGTGGGRSHIGPPKVSPFRGQTP